jgi:hypothetical protein
MRSQSRTIIALQLDKTLSMSFSRSEFTIKLEVLYWGPPLGPYSSGIRILRTYKILILQINLAGIINSQLLHSFRLFAQWSIGYTVIVSAASMKQSEES